MLRRSKTLSIVMSLCLCLAMLAPVFVAPPTADAGSAITYSAANTITVKTKSAAQDVDIKVLIDVPEASVCSSTYDSYFSVQLPSGSEFIGAADVNLVDVSGDGNIALQSKTKVSSNTMDFAVKETAAGETKLLLTISQLKVKSGSGDFNLQFTAPSGSPFPSGTVTVGKIVGSGGTNTWVSSVKNMSEDGCTLDDITIEELISTLENTEKIKLSLPKGYEWIDPTSATATGGWNFPSTVGTLSKDNARDLILTLSADVESIGKPGKIQLHGLQVATTNSADYGDVELSIDSDKDNVTEQNIVVAKYADYGVTVNEGTKEDITSGRTEQEIGEFTIEESVAGSLLANRSIKMELPDGVEWIDADDNGVLDTGTAPKIELTDGSMNNIDNCTWTIEDSNNKIIKTTVPADASTDAVTLKIKDAEVRVKADFEGPVEITVSGTAGAAGTVAVATAKKPVAISAENVKDVIVGQASQKVADIILTEADKDMIMDTTFNKDIVISLEDGYKFTSKPTVTVEEGNLEIDSVKLQNEDNDLKIVVKYGSTKASKIRISDVAITAYRYVPVGPLKATLVGADFDVSATGEITGVNSGSSALADWDTDKSMGSVVIANCVTPAEGASTQFKIGSNVYTVNGVAKIMDVAPYIKDSRTYVPVRYLAYALGVSESDVVWDAATSKVTITKGDKVVELTIGSTTITVNGEAQTMDVAPEIANSRTMLPARFVAEGLGATVGWDAATSTVYVQQ